MKFPTFVAVCLLAVVALSVPFMSDIAAARDRGGVDRERPANEPPVQPPREESTAPEPDEDEVPKGNVVYNKNGVVVQVEEQGDTTTVTVTIDGKIASKTSHTKSSDGNNTGGNDAGPGEDGDDGDDGDDNDSTPPPAEEEEDERTRPERDTRTR